MAKCALVSKEKEREILVKSRELGLEGSHLENSNKPTIHSQIKKLSFLIMAWYSNVKSLTWLDFKQTIDKARQLK